MKKMLVSVLTVLSLLAVASSANAHGWRGGGGGHRSGWAPFAVGSVAGAVVPNAYYRPAPIYHGSAYYPRQYYYYPQQNTALFCPGNGLYYPQAQACPSRWQIVHY